MGKRLGKQHAIIPDLQVRPGVDLSYCSWYGRYIAEQEPDVIICIGDFADMESLSSYDKGTKSFEGRRYKKDLEAAREGMNLLMAPIKKKINQRKKNKKKQWKPRFVMVLGNHEHRIARAVEKQPELDGILSYDDLPYEDWEVYDFLNPAIIDGIAYSHYIANPFTGKPYSGTARNILLKAGRSFVAGHKQCLDFAIEPVLGGGQNIGIIAGAGYPHDEAYKGYQGNNHWRGMTYLHEAGTDTISPMFVSINYLEAEYGD